MSVNRTVRVVALIVLLVSAVQIGMCAFDCDCFLPAARGIMARSAADADGCGDTDGCICCAACGHFTTVLEVPRLAWADFVPSVPPLQIVLADASLPYRPPRS